MNDAVKYKELKVKCYGTGESGPFAEMEDGRRVYGLTGHAPELLASLCEALNMAIAAGGLQGYGVAYGLGPADWIDGMNRVHKTIQKTRGEL